MFPTNKSGVENPAFGFICCGTACRPLQNFQGVLDPLKGDALNAKVREAAKETVEAIFEASAPQPMHSSGISSQVCKT